MFYYKENKFWYFIYSDKIKWEFWPFEGIFCKNKFLTSPLTLETSPLAPLLRGEGKIKELEKKYPAYKYSLWFSWKKIFVIWKSWLENIILK